MSVALVKGWCIEHFIMGSKIIIFRQMDFEILAWSLRVLSIFGLHLNVPLWQYYLAFREIYLLHLWQIDA